MSDPLANPDLAIRRVYAYVAYRVGDGPDAEDITSDVLERAVRYRGSYRRSHGEPVQWLLGIARRCIADHLRSNPALTHELPEGSMPDGSEAVVDRADLRQALAALDDRERELVALRYGADLTAREIARILAVRTNAVEVALHRALVKLRSATSTQVTIAKRGQLRERHHAQGHAADSA